jgi:hypothetical protein
MSWIKRFIILVFALGIGGLAGALVFVLPDITYDVLHPISADLKYIEYYSWKDFMGAAAIFTIPTALISGIPSFYILRRKRRLNWINVSIIGVIAGALVAIPLYRELWIAPLM